MVAHKKPRVQKSCIICGSTFENAPYKAAKQATCLSEECKKVLKHGIHNPFYGRKHTEESKAKVSRAKTLPRIQVECTCGCGETMDYLPRQIKNNKTNTFFVNPSHMYKWAIEENHWNYRGGNIYYGDGWERTAKSVRERDKVCQMCGMTPEENKRALDVHHKIPVRVSFDNSMENLIALCMGCHRKVTVQEQYQWPTKVVKYRKCIVCEQIFIPAAYQKTCSDECRRKRTRQWEKKHLDTHPEHYKKRREYIKEWQKANKDRVNASQRRTHLRKTQEN